MARSKIVVIDRDGVINHDSAEYIKSPAEWRPLPGSLEAIASLHAAGYRIFVVTNQSGLARGLFDAATLAAIHRRMHAAVDAAGGKLAGIYVCPHGPGQSCDCRKPKPGLLRQIEAQHAVSLRGQPLIGDKCSDLEAAIAVGARPILVRTGQGELALTECAERAESIHRDLAAAVDALLAERD